MRSFHESFRKDVTYYDIKGHKKTFWLEDTFWEKLRWDEGSKIDTPSPAAFLGLKYFVKNIKHNTKLFRMIS